MEERKVPVLTLIQNELKAPKSQWNDYGKYHYRNAEDIMSGLKPLLMKYGALLYFGDALVDQAGRLLTVELHYNDGEQRIDKKIQLPLEPHKGMTSEQASGAALSYAKKYALCDLLLIDDGQDFDAMDNRREGYKSRSQQPSTSYQHRQAPQNRPQASASTKEVVQNEARSIMVGDKTLLDVCRQAKLEGRGGAASVELSKWAADKDREKRFELLRKIDETGAWQ